MGKSVFNNVVHAQPVEVFRLTKLFNECPSSSKVNLGVGAYRDEDGRPWVLPIVSAVERQMANDRTLNHEYLPIAGLSDFCSAACRLMLGSGHRVLAENKVEGFQAPGGTGALRLAAAFLRNVMRFDTVYVSDPTWENHIGVFLSAGFAHVKTYRYWNSETTDLNFIGMRDDLMNAQEHSVVILHAVAHNPTGMDPTVEQWHEICSICKERNLFVLIDCAYQGFASGDLERDGWAARYFASQDMDLFIAQSFSKNFGLYNERVGNLVVISRDKEKLPEIRSQMEIQIRIMWSNPPNHGARIVATVLNNAKFCETWKQDLLTMAHRIKKMREELVDNLKILGTPGSWDHITKQIGMFSYTGLKENQVKYLRSKHIFLLRSGRISVAGLTRKNVAYVAKAIDEAVRAYPTLQLSESAGEPALAPRKFYLEFSKQKLGQTDYNVIKTPVVVEGVIMKEGGEVQQDDDVQSVESFIKVQMVGSLSSTTSLDAEVTQQFKGSKEQLEAEKADVTGEHLQEEGVEPKEVLSTSTQPGTLRTSVKTFKTRSIQTLKANEVEDLYQPRAVPARFEGTMITPVYFDGLMLTPERLDTLLTDTSKKGEKEKSIPVKFQGGMLTAAFKTLAENLNLGFGTDPVNVKFHGKLKGLTSLEDGGIPVAFDGSMIAQEKSTKKSKDVHE